eukprot:4772902-Amphidinium_carterae.4
MAFTSVVGAIWPAFKQFVSYFERAKRWIIPDYQACAQGSDSAAANRWYQHLVSSGFPYVS